MTDPTTASASAAPPRDDGVTSNPAHELWVAQIADPGDAAFDRAHPEFDRALARYSRTRSLVDLAKVPLVAGGRLTLWLLRPLRSAERTDVKNAPGEPLQRYMAFRTAVHKRMDAATVDPDGKAQGTVVEATVDRSGAMPMASAEWMDGQTALAGGDLVDELGALVIARAGVHPKAPAPYKLPWPLVASRPSRS